MSLQHGQAFGRYRIVRKIGEGGMGEVYEAQDTELDRRVALKVLPAAVSEDPDRLERFRREARAIAALNHPNIITLHGIEENGDQRFLVMERVEGQGLDRLIPSGGLPLSQVFDLAIPMAEALATAHEKRIVHRDFKPANVMVTPEGRVKVLDFGLAKMATQPDPSREVAPSRIETHTPTLTAEGVVLGTAPYMSPEQLQNRPVDHRTDIFSLGIVLYEMVTGARPFQGDSTIALASSILKDEPQAVSQGRDDLPRHLGRIIEHCLEKDPDRRFQSAKDVRNQLAALRRETQSEPASSVVPVVATAPAWGTRRTLWTALTALLALVLVVVAIAVVGRSRGPTVTEATSSGASALPADARKMIVVLPFENLGEPEDGYFADGITEEITSRLAILDGLGVISRTSAMQYKGARRSAKEIGEELGVDYILEGTVRWQRESDGSSRVRVTPQLIDVGKDTHLWAERYDRVLEDIFDVQSDIARQVSQQLDLALLEPDILSLESRLTHSVEAYDTFLRGNDYLNRGQELNDSEQIRFAIDMYEEAVRQDPQFALAHARLSVAHGIIHGEADRTPERLAAAQASLDRALELDPELPEALYARGRLLAENPDTHARAIEEFQRALAKQPNNAEIWEAISQVQLDEERWEDGLSSLEKAMELNPKLGRLPCSTGGTYFALRDWGKAVFYHERAIRLTPDRACPYVCQLWICLNRDGNTRKARQVLAEIPESVGLEQNPPILEPWVAMEMLDGNYDEALERLFSQPGDAFEAFDSYLPKVLLAAQIFDLQGRTDEARRSFQVSAVELEQKLREQPDDGRILSALAIAYAGLGRREEAVRLARRGAELRSLNWSATNKRIRDLAQVYVMVGDEDAAIDALDALLSKPSIFAAPYLNADPALAPLRDHPRFQALIAKYTTSPS